MEELLLGQVRGLLIMANAQKRQNNTRLYVYYLNRANDLLIVVQKNRNWYERKAA